MEKTDSPSILVDFGRCNGLSVFSVFSKRNEANRQLTDILYTDELPAYMITSVRCNRKIHKLQIGSKPTATAVSVTIFHGMRVAKVVYLCVTVHEQALVAADSHKLCNC